MTKTPNTSCIPSAFPDSSIWFPALFQSHPCATLLCKVGPHAINNIIHANDAACKLLGYSQKALLTRTFSQLEHHSQPPEIKTAHPSTLKTTVYRHDTTLLPITLTITPLSISSESLALITLQENHQDQEIVRLVTDARQKFLNMAEVLPCMLFETDIKGKLIYANTYGLTKLGYSVEDLKKGLNVLHMISAKDRSYMISNIKKILQGSDNLGADYVVIKKNGDHLPVKAYATRIMENNLPIGLQGVLLDQEEQQKVERGLHEYKSKATSIIEQSTDGILVIDAHGTILEWNNAMTKITGISNQDAIGQRQWDIQYRLTPKNQRQTYTRQYFRKLLTNRTSQTSGNTRGATYEREIEREDKQQRAIFVTTFPIITDKGAMYGSIVRDVTDIRKAFDLLKETQAHQQAMINNISDMVWLKDKKHTFIQVNESFAKNVGKPLQEILGKTDFDVWPPELAKSYRQTDLEVIRTKKPQIMQEVLALPNGQKQWVETVRRPVFNTQGVAIGTVGISRDITEKKTADDLNKEHMANLERFKDVTVNLALDMQKMEHENTMLKKELDKYKNAQSLSKSL